MPKKKERSVFDAPKKMTKKHPSQHECMSDACRTDESKIGYGHDALFFVKVGRCRECLRRVAPCDVAYRTEESKDPRNYIEDGVRLGSCRECGGSVLVTMDVQCSVCGEMWFWWDVPGLRAADVTSEATGVICSCPSCDGECFMIGAGETSEIATVGPPRGIVGQLARSNAEFREIYRNALVHLKEAYTLAAQATESLAAAEEFIGRMTVSVVDEFDAIMDKDGQVQPEWPSDAFAYYNEQLGRAVAMRGVANSVAEHINDIAVGLREHARRGGPRS
jgi:hypothetical protein